MKLAIKKLFRSLLIILALAAGLILFGIVPFSAGFIRTPIEDAVRDATGLNFSIGGPITLRLGSKPEFISGDLELGDTANDRLLIVDTLSAKIGLFPLLGGRIHLRNFSAAGIRVDYCSPLPTFSGKAGEDTAPPSIVVDAINIKNITIRCDSADQTDKLKIDILNMLGSAAEGGPMQLQADGNLSGVEFKLLGSGGELDALLIGDDSFPLELSLESENVVINISGNLHAPQVNPAIDAEFAVQSANVQSLLSSLSISLPTLGSLQAEGLIRADSDNIELTRFDGELGESRIELNANLDLTGERAQLEMTVMLEQLDLKPLLNSEHASQRQNQVAGPADIDLRPALDALEAFDANLRLSIKKVLGVPLALNEIDIAASLVDNIVRMQLLAAPILGGHVNIDGGFDNQSDCPELQLHVRGSGLDLATLNPVLTLDKPIGGHTGAVELKTTSCGDSLLAHRNSLRAELDLADGRISFGGNLLPLSAEQLHANIAFNERGNASLTGKLANEQVRATLAIGSLAALLDADPWPIELDALGAGGYLQLKGRAGIMPGQVMLDALVEFEAQEIGSLHAWTAGPPEATLPLRASTRLLFDEFNLIADTIALSLGESDLSGRAVWKHAENPDTLALAMRSGFLDLDQISAAFVAEKNEPETLQQTGNDEDKPLIPAGFALPPVDLDVKFDALTIHQFDLQDLEVSGRLRGGLIDEARISVVVENEVRLRGNLDLDARSSPANGVLRTTAENVNVGRLLDKLDVADDLQLRADELEITVTTEGETPIQFLLNASLAADMQGFNWLIPRADSTAAENVGDGFELSLEHVRLTTGPEQRTTWASHGEAQGVPLEVWMETPSLMETFGDAPELPLKLVAAAGNNVAMVEARIDRSTEPGYLAHILLSGAVIENKNRLLGQLQSPLPDYEVSSEVTFNDKKLTLPNLQMRFGSSKVSGSFSLNANGERGRTDITLHAPYLQTDDLHYWATNFRDDANADGQPGYEEEEDQEESEEEAESGIFFIAKDFITKFREDSDLDLSITVDELYAGTDLLGGAELDLVIHENEFILNPLHVYLPGGDLAAAYTTKTVDGRLDAELKIHAEALRYGGLLRLADPESQARGVLYIDTEINANTEWSPGATAFDLLLRNANGSFELAAWPENAEAGMLDVWTANLVLALLPKPTAEKSALLNCLAARLEVENGVLQTGTALLDSTDTIVRGRGKIDMAREELELLVAPQAKREKFLSMSTPVMVTGPFDDFQIGVVPGGIFATAMKWWMSLVYVPFKWLTGERFPADGAATCFKAMDWELTPELHNYFLQRDFSTPPPTAED